MRDYMHNFGVGSMVTAGTRADCPNPMNFTAIDARAQFQKNHDGMAENPLVVVVKNDAALAAGDYMTPIIIDSADNITYTEIGRGKQSAAALAINTRQIVPLPVAFRQYLNVGALPGSGTTFTTRAFSAWLEQGPNLPNAEI